MTGPDSDRWPAHPEGNQSWNWQSTDACLQAESLLEQGADDDHLLVEVGRYTVENLILNAVHEIGEWLRFDGRRVFPAHPDAPGPSAGRDAQGNGPVNLAVTFGPAAPKTPAVRAERPVDQVSAQRALRRLTQLAGPPSRLTFQPGTSVQYQATGPVIRLHSDGRPATGWQSVWSGATLDAALHDGDAQTLLALAQRDVHAALVAWEADRICRSFYIDDRRPWRLAAPGTALGDAEDADGGRGIDGVLALEIAYSSPAPTNL